MQILKTAPEDYTTAYCGEDLSLSMISWTNIGSALFARTNLHMTGFIPGSAASGWTSSPFSTQGNLNARLTSLPSGFLPLAIRPDEGNQLANSYAETISHRKWANLSCKILRFPAARLFIIHKKPNICL